jgi:malate dehydrogenase (oxaloacetate-decarboxylating)
MLNFKIKIDPTSQEKYLETSLTGKQLLTIPQLNKGTAFSQAERHAFKLFGKLPEHEESLEEQVQRAYLQYQSYSTPLQKNTFLNKLHDTNLVLFFKLVQNHESEMIPIIYTPTVSTAVEKFSREFNQVRGLYICYEQRYEIEEILENRSNPEIDLIVTTDGGGVLGIGDQGVGAMLIPVAKLMVYTICGGINPLRTLPILLDVGTNNEMLLNDPFYLGWRHPRINGSEYEEFIECFISAIKKKLPNVFLQWEDFGRDNARKILDRYREKVCSFNDDIQGTGATTLAALLAAVTASGSTLNEQRIIIFGGGNAGTGIADQICDGMQRLGIPLQSALEKFWIIDRNGLLHEGMPDLTASQQPYARKISELHACELSEKNPISLLETIRTIKPTVLIGCSACTGSFNRECIIEMSKHVERPIIFPLSNPTEKVEAFPSDLIEWTQGKALTATGTLFPPVVYDGKKRRIAQCNNALIFPGIGLGSIAVHAQQVTDNMFWAACQALYQSSPIHSDPDAPLLPAVEDAYQSSHAIAIAVAKQAIADNVAAHRNIENLEELIDQQRWQPEYLPYRLE